MATGKCPGWASESILQAGAVRQDPVRGRQTQGHSDETGKIALFCPGLTVNKGHSQLVKYGMP